MTNSSEFFSVFFYKHKEGFSTLTINQVGREEIRVDFDSIQTLDVESNLTQYISDLFKEGVNQ